MEKIKLSVVIATKNDLDNIENCIRNVSFAKEIILVDMFSTDGTVEVAKKLGCKVISNAGGLLKLVTYNKNLGYKAAKYPWVLCIDTDERLTDDLKREIEEIVKFNSRDFDCYKHKSINVEFGMAFDKCSMVHMMGVVRLFKRGHLRFDNQKNFDGASIFITKGSVGQLQNPVIHDSHKYIESFINKINIYSEKEALIRFKNNPSFNNTQIIKLPFTLFKEFGVKFFKWGLYKHGLHGFIVTIIFIFYTFLIFTKHYEKSYIYKNKKNIDSYRKKHKLSSY